MAKKRPMPKAIKAELPPLTLDTRKHCLDVFRAIGDAAENGLATMRGVRKDLRDEHYANQVRYWQAVRATAKWARALILRRKVCHDGEVIQDAS